MSKPKNPIVVSRRKDSKTFFVTLNETCGLPRKICDQWQRKSFSNLPESLAYLRNPKTKSAAESSAHILIEYLKKPDSPDRVKSVDIDAGAWLKKFTVAEGNPRGARNMAKNRPYSIKTLKGYECYFNTHLQSDKLMSVKMSEIDEADAMEFISRMAERKLINGEKMGGTRTFEGVLKFVRMAFTEYGKTHRGWINPFIGIDPPQKTEAAERGTLCEKEILSLFSPKVLLDSMELAVCAVMFFAGLRRSEIFALTPDCLDWKTPKIIVRQTWQRFDNTDRVLGPTKGKRARHTPFHPILQEAIKKLWEENGQHEFVFAYKDGTTPGPSWIKGRFEKWLARAGIDTKGRNIVPHSARHSLASLLVDHGASVNAVQDLLGHSDYKTTKIYLHTTDMVIREIGNKIDAAVQADRNKDLCMLG